MKTAIQYNGKGNTFIRVSLLPKARKGDYEKDIIEIEIQSFSTKLAGVMTEEEAIILASGLINAIVMKIEKEKRI